MRRNAEVSAAQRAVRLLFMIGIAVAAYFALSILDQGARADGGASDLTLKSESVGDVADLSDHRERTDPGPEAAGSAAADGGDRCAR